MSTELIEAGSQTITVVPDIASDLQLVARDAEEMKAAQAQMAAWFAAKEQIAETDYEELSACLCTAEQNNWRLAPLKRQVQIARKRKEFYQKCRIACEAGYAIIPNLPADVFAIRTTKRKPKAMPGRWSRDRNQSSEGPPAGEGDYVDATPIEAEHSQIVRDPKTNEMTTTPVWLAAEFDDEIEFPISVAKPEVMSETARAMALKVFDEIAVLPERRKKGDPLVLGTIRKGWLPKYPENEITFLIAWYLDTRTL